MSNSVQDVPSATILDPNAVECLDVLGPTIQILTPLAGAADAPCIMRGVIPPGVIVPLHSHGDPETFIQMSGELEGLSLPAGGYVWVSIRPGDVFNVPGGAKHGFRNRTSRPAVCTIVSTTRMGRFFESIGIPVASGSVAPVSPERLQRFLKTADAFGYWNASPEENARAGLDLPPMGTG
jgi:uncharacterized RmlC-like cupin family protein